MPPSIPRLRACAARGCRQSSASGARVKACARCKTSHYCSTECQTADWPTHKQICSTNSSVDDVFRSLTGGPPESARLSIDLRRWESLHTPTFLVTCINGMGLSKTPQNMFSQALVVHVEPRGSKDPRAKFAIVSAGLESFESVSELLRNAGYDDVVSDHERENENARSDGALGHALVLIVCKVPSPFPRLLQIKPVLITREAIEAYNRSPAPIGNRDSLTQALQRAIDEDWARFYHMSVVATRYFLGDDALVQARA